MKYISIILILLVSFSCRSLLVEKKLIYDNTTKFIIPTNRINPKIKYFLIPIEKVKECRNYPNIDYLGTQDNYSFFGTQREFEYRDEITTFAIPDSICINKYPHTIDEEFEFRLRKIPRQATIVNNKMVVSDN